MAALTEPYRYALEFVRYERHQKASCAFTSSHLCIVRDGYGTSIRLIATDYFSPSYVLYYSL